MMKVVSGFAWDGAVYASYLKQAYRFAQHSPDPSTQVGCVIVHPTMGVMTGTSNSLPHGITETDEILLNKDTKSIYMEHAERNALYRCCQSVLSTKGCHAYSTLAPCSDCARGLIQAGVTKLVAHKEMLDLYDSPSIRESIRIGWDMMTQAGVECVLWSGRVFELATVQVRVRGRLWTP